MCRNIFKGLIVMCSITFLFFLTGCVTADNRGDIIVSENTSISIVGSPGIEFVNSIKDIPDYSLFNQVLNKLSSKIEIYVENENISTYSSYSGFNGYAQSTGVMRITTGNSTINKDYQIRVDGKDKNNKNLEEYLSNSLAFSMIKEMKNLFIYLTGDSLTNPRGIAKTVDMEIKKVHGPVYTISTKDNASELKSFVQRITGSLQKLGFSIIQPEYLKPLIELNKYNLSAMTEDTGAIINFFDIQYLIIVDKAEGFYNLKIMRVSTAELITSFSISQAISESNLYLTLKEELSDIK